MYLSCDVRGSKGNEGNRLFLSTTFPSVTKASEVQFHIVSSVAKSRKCKNFLMIEKSKSFNISQSF